MTFQRGRSGNPTGGPRGPRKATERVRAAISDSTGTIVEAIIQAAKDGDWNARQLFVKHLMPKQQRTVWPPIDLPPAQTADEAQRQISVLTSAAARGDLDLDALRELSQALARSIDTRLARLEELLEEREGEGGADER